MQNKYLPKLIIFDMDGLMFDTERLFRDHLKQVCATYGYEMTDDFYVETLGTAGAYLEKIMLDHFGYDYPFHEISAKTKQLVHAYMEVNPIPVKDGIPELLNWLHEQQIPCCVASSSHADTVNHHLAHAGLADYFSLIIGGDMVTCAKPDPEIFLKACIGMNTAPENALVLEDSPNGVLAAINGGIPVICIPDLKRPDSDILNQTAAVLSNASMVIDHLKSVSTD